MENTAISLSKRSVFQIALLSLIIYSCQSRKGDQEEIRPQPVPVEFSLATILEEGNGGSGRLENDASAVLISVEASDGTLVYTDEKIELISFGSSYTTSPLDFVPGTYIITSFLVINSENEALWAAPLVGSEKTKLVQTPLPLSFTVVSEGNVTVEVEVVKIGSTSPADFGYATFIPVFINSFEVELSLFVLDENGNTNTIPGSLKVTDPNDFVIHKTLNAGNNIVELRELSGEFTFEVFSQSGQFAGIFTRDSLITHEPGLTPLKIIIRGTSNADSIFQETATIVGGLDGNTVTSLGDIDQDGDLDILLSTSTLGRFLQNDGSGNFTSGALQDFPVNQAVGLYSGDFYIDEGPVILIIDADINGFTITASGSLGGSGNRRITSSGSLFADIGDLESDGDLDILSAKRQFVDIFKNDGFRSGNPTAAGVERILVATNLSSGNFSRFVDANNDGLLDVLIGQADGSPNFLHLNDGQNNYQDVETIGFSNITSAAFGDLDGDQHIDMLIVGNNHLEFWLNDGAANFTKSDLQLAQHNIITDVAIEDLDRDGDLDLFVLTDDQEDLIFLNNGIGVFASNGQLFGGPSSVKVQLGDLNGNGLLDAFIMNANGINEVYLDTTGN